jgi:hypothetical protein
MLSPRETSLAFTAERTFMTAIGGSCNAPCGAYCEARKDGMLLLRGMYAEDAVTPEIPDGGMPAGRDGGCRGSGRTGGGFFTEALSRTESEIGERSGTGARAPAVLPAGTGI